MSPILMLLRYRSSTAFIVATLCLAFFTDDFIYGLIVPVLPFSLPMRSGIPQHNVQFWTSAMLTAFGLANLLGSPSLGWLADCSSRKGFLLLGLVMQGAATVLFGLVTNVYALVTSRLLQGFSAAIVYIGGFALLVDTVGHDDIGKWMGFVMSFGNLGLLLSPFLGGIIYGNVGYHAIFYSMLALVVLDIVLRLAMVTKSSASSLFDSAGQSKIVRNEREQGREDDPLLTSLEGRRVHASLNGISARNGESRTPTILVLLSRPRILTALYGVLVAQTLITSFDGVLSIFVHRVFGWGSTRAGLMFLTVTIPTLATPLAGMLSDKYGPRWVATSGYGLAATVLALLPLVTHASIDQAVILCLLLTVLGCTFSLMISPLAADLATAVEGNTKEILGIGGSVGVYGQVFSLLNCGISAGVLLGPSLAGFLYETFGWKTMAWTLAVISASAVMPIAIHTGNQRSAEDELPTVA